MHIQQRAFAIDPRGTGDAIQLGGVTSCGGGSALDAALDLRQDCHKATAAHSSKPPTITHGSAISQIPAPLPPAKEFWRTNRPQLDMSKPIVPIMIETIAFICVLPGSVRQFLRGMADHAIARCQLESADVQSLIAPRAGRGRPCAETVLPPPRAVARAESAGRRDRRG